MKYCMNCGKQLDDRAVICPHCGVPQEKIHIYNDSGSIGWAILGFLVPVAGLVLFLIWKDERPESSKMAGIGALVSVCLSAASGILAVVLAFVTMSAGMMW